MNKSIILLLLFALYNQYTMNNNKIIFQKDDEPGSPLLKRQRNKIIEITKNNNNDDKIEKNNEASSPKADPIFSLKLFSSANLDTKNLDGEKEEIPSSDSLNFPKISPGTCFIPKIIRPLKK